jgi:hypothetical protein
MRYQSVGRPSRGKCKYCGPDFIENTLTEFSPAINIGFRLIAVKSMFTGLLGLSSYEMSE